MHPNTLRAPHHIEILTGDCSLCKEVVDIITIGKCATCKMDTIDVDAKNPKITNKLKDYNIIAVPSIVIDGKIKVVGIPDFPWFCGEEF